MTMNLYRNKPRRPLASAFLTLILISVALFGFDALTSGFVRSYARTMSALAWSGLARTVETIDQSGWLHSRRTLTAERDRLQDEVHKRDEQAARFGALIAENDALRAMAMLAEEENAGVTARVLSSFQSSPYGTFIIGVGERSGVAVGDSVLTPGGFVLGEVRDVDSHTATVRALFAPGEENEFLVEKIAFTATGHGGGNARATLPRDSVVTKGSTVTLPRLNNRPAGIIGEIESASSSATQTLFLRLPINLGAIQFVYVLTR